MVKTKSTPKGTQSMEKKERCKYCGRPFDMEVDNAEEKLKSAMGLQHGKEIYYAIQRKEFRSIDICNFHYVLLKSYILLNNLQKKYE